MAEAAPSPKRGGFSFNFFRRNKAKALTPENVELKQRKAIVQEGHKYLSKTIDILNNKDGLDTRHMNFLHEKWAK